MDVIRVNWQTNPQLKNEIAVAKMIKAEKGLKGFYFGFATNCAKQLTKSSYRYPFITTLPRVYAKVLGLDYEKNLHKMKLMTSFSLAMLEAGVITPFERLQVFMMTAKAKSGNYADFYNMCRTKMRTELFRGFSPYFTKQLVAWTTFLQVDAFYKRLVRRIFSIPDDQMITGLKMALCSFMICCSTIMIVMPFDNIKTYLQKYNLEVVDKKIVGQTKEKLGLKDAVRNIYTRGGALGFFIGWRAKLMVYFVNYSFTIILLEYLDQFAKKAFA